MRTRARGDFFNKYIYKEKFNYLTIQFRSLIFDYPKKIRSKRFWEFFVRGDYDFPGSVCIFLPPQTSVVIGSFAAYVSSLSS